MTPPRYLGSHEVAERWGISRARVFQILADDPRMPRGEKLKGAHVWGADEIATYEQESGRRPKGVADADQDPEPGP
jgi:predicted DNA-binding transcriptional regulator AlpA